MFAKLPRLAVLSTAVFATATVVRGQQDAPPRSPWPFGNSWNSLWSNGNSGSSSNSGTMGSQAGSQSSSSSGNSGDAQSHSVADPNESNRRLYGPSLAIRPGVADGYAPPNATQSPRASNRRSADDMLPVVSQGTPSSSGTPFDKVTGNGSSVTGQYPLAAGSSTRDSRPLADRVKSLQQSADMDNGRSMSMADEAAQGPSMPSRTGSSRRVAPPSAEIVDEEHKPHLAPAEMDALDGVASRRGSSGSAEVAQPRIAKRETAPAEQSEPRARLPSHPSPSERSDSESSSLSGPVALARQSPLVSVETTGPRSIMIGREATYLVTIKNSGEVAAQDVAAIVKIPEWTDVAGSQVTAGTTRVAASDANEPFQWKIPRLEAHSKETLTLRLLPRKGRGFDLAVQWTFSPIATQTIVDVQEPKLTLSLAGPDEVVYGQSKLYRLTIANPGTGDAENVIIKLDPIGNSTAGPSKHPVGTIHAGDSKVVELELTARQTGAVSIHATAMAEPGLKAEVAQEVVVRRAAVALTVEGIKCKYAGTVGTYTIRVNNSGNAPAESVRVAATLPAGAKFVAASEGGQWKADQGKVTWTLPPLRPGAEAMLDLKCVLMTPGANRLQVASTAAGDVSDAANITTNIEALADLKLEVSEPAGPIAVGDEVVYELHVRNRGSKAAEGVGVTTYFSEGIEPVSAEGGTHDIANGVVAFHPVVTLAPGAELSLTVKARAERGGKQVFRAEVECSTLGTKLVNAEEMMVFGGDETPGLERADHAVAGRNPPLQSVPNQAEQDARPLRK